VRENRKASRFVANPRSILVIQTAFLGDVVLTLPLVQITKRAFPSAQIDFLTIPRTASVLSNHPAIAEVIEFDKRGKDRGIGGILRMARDLRRRQYDVALIPHRSMRSAAVASLAKIPTRIGFNRSAGKLLLTDVVLYRKGVHEIERNIDLLKPFGVSRDGKELPSLYPSASDSAVVDALLKELGYYGSSMIAVAPGTVWNTKRWPQERFSELVRRLARQKIPVVLIGGAEDVQMCREISGDNDHVRSVAGRLSFLQSAELIRRSSALVCNDSAPMHLAAAMRTPVVAIFGATVPEFGFAPYGENDVVVETKGLECRPCSIHGGEKCPITTFVCMRDISAEAVYLQTVRTMRTG
jgi:heptosyltransferase-2